MHHINSSILKRCFITAWIIHVYCINKIGHLTKDCSIIQDVVNLFKTQNGQNHKNPHLQLLLDGVNSYYSNMLDCAFGLKNLLHNCLRKLLLFKQDSVKNQTIFHFITKYLNNFICKIYRYIGSTMLCTHSYKKATLSCNHVRFFHAPDRYCHTW